jgi:chemotaxis protein MotA
MSLGFLFDGPAALIVLGGTAAAIALTYRATELRRAGGAALATFRVVDDDTDALAATLLTLAIRAHRKGLPALEAEAEGVAEPFLRDGMMLVADAAPLESIRQVLAEESATRQAGEEAPARIFEAAAGYAPTLGVLGAVLGLAQVMQRLTEPGALGAEIAVAFVATIYGVGAANLVLLPISGRIRERAAFAARRREMMTHALCAMRAQMHPRLLAQKLRAYATHLPRIEELAARSHASARAASRADQALDAAAARTRTSEPPMRIPA